MCTIKDLLKYHRQILHLQIIAGEPGLRRKIFGAEVCRPIQSDSDFSLGNSSAKKRILILGKEEVSVLCKNQLPAFLSKLRTLLVQKKILAVIFCDNCMPPEEIINFCNQFDTPLFHSILVASEVFNQLVILVINEVSPKVELEGSLLEVFGVGVLIQADPSVGTSEAAIGLVEKHHRLITDGVVAIRKREGFYLEGSSIFPNQHYINVRGMGNVNIAKLYGAVRICNSIRLNIIVKLEEWNEKRFYDRIGLEEKFSEILGVKISFHVLPVKPGRDIVLLLETIALNHHLKSMGCHSVKEFEAKLLEKCSEKK